MKIVGKRQIRPISKHASGYLLKQGALFNDEIHGLPTGDMTFFPKGLYRYKTHEEANAQMETWVIEGMAKHARK